jgi:hypothetical protein
MKSLVLTSAASMSALATVPLAGAQAPPSRSYDCTIGGSTLFGTLEVRGAGRYTYDGKAGTFAAGTSPVKFPDKTSGWTLTFKGGGLSGYKGRWYFANGGPGRRHVPEIALKNPTDGFESIYCDL